MPVPDDAAGEDTRWLAGQSDKELSEHISTGWELVLAGFPPHSSVAVDLRVYNAGLTRVLGMPPAPAMHVLSLLSTGADANGPPGGSCVAVFLSETAGAVVTVSYDDTAATLRASVVDPACPHAIVPRDHFDERDKAQSVGDRGVSIYTQPHWGAWARLSDCVTVGTLQAAGGVVLLEAVVAEDELAASADMVDGVHSAERQRHGGADGPVKLQFLKLPLVRSSAGMTAAEVTAFNMDRTEYVTWLVATRFGGRSGAGGLLGEAQLAYLTFLLLRGIGGLAHWASLLREVCGACDGLVADAPEVVAAFSRTLSAQLELVEDEVVAAESDALQNAVLNLCAAGRELEDVRKLARVVKQRFDWTAGTEHI